MKDYMKDYQKEKSKNWNKFIKLIAKFSINMAILVVVRLSVNKACDVISAKLNELYKNTIVNSLIILGLNILGFVIVILKPFESVASNYLSALCFITAMMFSLIRIICNIKNNGKMAFELSKRILKKRSVSKGIENYVFAIYPIIPVIYTGIDIASVYLISLKRIPRFNETVKLFIQIFWKRIVIYISAVSFYTIGIFWIIKPILLREFAGITCLELYLYPFYHTLNMIFNRR